MELAADPLVFPLAGSGSCRSRCGTGSGNGRTTILKEKSLTISNDPLGLLSSPLTWIIGPEPEHHVAVVGHSDRILGRRQIVLTMQQTATIEIQGVLQIDLLDIRVGRSADTDNFEGVAVQVERMAQVGLLDCSHGERERKIDWFPLIFAVISN